LGTLFDVEFLLGFVFGTCCVITVSFVFGFGVQVDVVLILLLPVKSIVVLFHHVKFVQVLLFH
jgi:hypothetical protein